MDPNREGLGIHIAMDGDRVVEVHESRAGRYTLEQLNLNSATHRKRRQMRAEYARAAEVLRTLMGKMLPQIEEVEAAGRDASDLREEYAALQSSLSRQTATLGQPWDAPPGCYCAKPA